MALPPGDIEGPLADAVALDAYPVALVQLDAAGVVLGCNAAWAAAMEARAPGTPFARYVHPEDRARWAALLREAYESCDVRDVRDSRGGLAAPVRERLRLVHPRGALRWFDCTLGRDGAGCCLALLDVTLDRRREIALEARLRGAMGLLNGMPGLLYRGRNNPSWTMEFVSDGCEALTGYPPEWFVNSHEHSYSQLILPEDVDYVWRGVQAALAERAAFELRYRIRCARGEIKSVWEKGAGIYSESSEVLGIEGAIFEVRGAMR